MKKKAGDLTIREIIKICDNTSFKDCYSDHCKIKEICAAIDIECKLKNITAAMQEKVVDL